MHGARGGYSRGVFSLAPIPAHISPSPEEKGSVSAPLSSLVHVQPREEFCGRSAGSFPKLRLVVEPIEEGTGNLAYLILIGRQPIYQPKLVKRKSMTSAFSNIPLSWPDNPDPSPIGLFLQVRQRNQRNQATSSDKTM